MHAIGLVHTACALLAMFSGAVVFGIAKGTRRHVLLGRIYAGSMLALNVTAFLIYRLFGGFGPFHFFALVSLATLAVGYGSVRWRRPAGSWLLNHYRAMCWSYVGLLAAGASEAIVRVEVLRKFVESRFGFGLAVFAASVVVCVAGGWLIGKHEARLVGGLTPPSRELGPEGEQ